MNILSIYKLYIKDLSEDEVEDLWLFHLIRLEVQLLKQFEKPENSLGNFRGKGWQLPDITLVSKKYKSKFLECSFKNTSNLELLDVVSTLINYLLNSYYIKRYLGDTRRGVFQIKSKSSNGYRSVTYNVSLSRDNWNFTDLYGEATRSLIFFKDYDSEASNSIKSMYPEYILQVYKFNYKSRFVKAMSLN